MSKIIEWQHYIELSIYNNYTSISDIVSISRTNKHFNLFAKKMIENYIQRLFDILQKCKKVNIIYNFKGSFQHHGDKNKYLYTNDYWYTIFNKKLDPIELSVYYAYFIKKYNYSSSEKIGSKFWIANIFEDGFIKLFPSIQGGSLFLIGNGKYKYFDRCIEATSRHIHNNVHNLTYKAELKIDYEYLSPVNKKMFERFVIFFENSLETFIDNMSYESFNNIIKCDNFIK